MEMKHLGLQDRYFLDYNSWIIVATASLLHYHKRKGVWHIRCDKGNQQMTLDNKSKQHLVIKRSFAIEQLHSDIIFGL